MNAPARAVTARNNPLVAAAAARFRTRSRVSDFIVFVLLPLLISTAAMTVGASWLLDGIAVSVNAQEEIRTSLAVESSISALEDRLAGIAADNAHWDDAVRETYGRINEPWASAMWGVGSADVNYDTMFLLSPEGAPLLAFSHGQRLAASPTTYLGPLLDKLSAFAKQSGAAFSTLATIAATTDGLAIIAAAPVLPTSPGIAIGQDAPNLLVLINHITPEETARLGQQYVVDGLALAPGSTAPPSGRVITNHWNEPVAVATWTPRKPGEIARAGYRTSVLGTMLGLLCVLLPLTLIYFRRLSELEFSQRQVLEAARHDPLTGLLTRNAFIDALEAFRAGSPDEDLALMLVEVGNMRDINDRHGVRAGDEVLKSVTQSLEHASGGRGLLARAGGESFALAFCGADCALRAEEAADQTINELGRAVRLGPERVAITLNIGIAAALSRGTEPDELMREADLALYHASQAGPGEWRRYDEALDIEELEGLAAR